ncbi:MAG: YqjF family protein [Haloglomus sp.]
MTVSTARDDPTLLTTVGRDVLFAHWPVSPARIRPLVPDPLSLDTFDGSAWVSVLAFENPAVVPGPTVPSWLPDAGFPQVNLRTYVTAGDDPGVYFLSLDAGRRAPALVGRRAFGLPFHHASARLTRRGDEVTVRSRRRDADAVFAARYRPTGDPFRAAPDSLAEFCIERFRYFLPVTERRPASLSSAARSGRDAPDVRVGTISRDPWTLRSVEATLRHNTLLDAAGLSAPPADPVVHYSPGFEMGVGPVTVRRPSDG